MASSVKMSMVSLILSRWTDARRMQALRQLAAHGAAHVHRHHNRAGLGQLLQARGDVDAVAEQIAVRRHHHVADMHADAHAAALDAAPQQFRRRRARRRRSRIPA